MTHPTTILPQQLTPDKQSDLTLIDVRTPVEFREIHAAGARNVPLDSLDLKSISEGFSANEPIFLLCKSGARAAKAHKLFLEAGLENVRCVEGGTDGWVNAGLPVVRGKKAISLERQVRIAAGSITFAGALAAIITQNVYLAGIPAFIGAGLVFAGLTDTCGMGMLIARMPWNQVSETSPACTINPETTEK